MRHFDFFNTENIAAGKRTYQSSTYSDIYANGTADKAVDGNFDSDFRNGHCSRTLRDIPSWWLLDLGKPMQVIEIRITNGLTRLSNGSTILRNQVYNVSFG